MTYTIAMHGVVRDVDGAMIPEDPRNADWRAYLAWCAAGNVPNQGPAEPVTARRNLNKRIVVERLAAAGKLTAAFQALGGPGALGYERWSASTSVDSQNADVLSLLDAIGADPAAILAPTPDAGP